MSTVGGNLSIKNVIACDCFTVTVVYMTNKELDTCNLTVIATYYY